MKDKKNWLKLIAKNMDDCYDIFEAIFNAIPYALVVLQNRQIVFANKNVENIFGWKNTELIGKDVNIFYTSEETYKKVGEEHYSYLEKKSTYQHEITFKRKDGKNILCNAYLARIGQKITDKKIIAMVEDITEKKIMSETLKEEYIKNQRATEDLIRLPESLLAIKDPYTAGHQKRVAEIAKGIAKYINLSQDTINTIYMAGLLHDIGKIAVPMEILSKPSKIGINEMNLIKDHPITAFNILKDIYLPWDITNIIIQHHERLDGSGYPNRLRNHNICIEARILAIADVIEAMTSFRPYRPALSLQEAIEEITKNSGKLYDQNVVKASIEFISRMNHSFFVKGSIAK